MASRKSPPRHRHDGSSPLPLGMDASSAPIKWDGANTVWPHDPRTGWSYCATIPSWVVIPEAKTAEGAFINPTVFYRVQVGIQSPQGNSVLRMVLRRFSDFLKLYAALKGVFRKKKIPPPPPKNALLRMNSSHSLLQERRHALEDWTSRLLEDIEISRSAPIAAFLELEAAARSAVNTIASAQEESSSVIAGPPSQDSGSFDPSPASGLSWNAGNSSVASVPSLVDYASDAACSTSGGRTPTTASELGVEIEMEALPDRIAFEERVQSKQTGRKGKEIEETSVVSRQSNSGILLDNDTSRITRTASDGTLGTLHRREMSMDSVSDISSAKASEQSVPISAEGPSDASLMLVAGIERRMEALPSFESDFLKGVSVLLPADQRGNVRRVLTALQRRFEIVKADMEDLITRLNQEVAVKEFLTTKVRDLEGELDNTRRKSQDVLRQAVSMERERVTELQWELEECRAALMNAEESLQTERDSRTINEEMLQSLESELQSSKQEIAQLEERVESLQKERDTIEAQARADKRVLAKEIKALRKSQPELKEELDMALQAKAELEGIMRREKQRQEKLRASGANFVHEVSALRQRLKECSVDFLAKEDKSGGKNAISSDAMELLTTSDNRISLLLAEAQLMAQEDEESPTGSPKTNHELDKWHADGVAADGMGSSEAAAMRKMLVDILIDNAQLRKGMNSLTRSALLTVQKRDKEALDEPIVARRSSVLNRFL